MLVRDDGSAVDGSSMTTTDAYRHTQLLSLKLPVTHTFSGPAQEHDTHIVHKYSASSSKPHTLKPNSKAGHLRR